MDPYLGAVPSGVDRHPFVAFDHEIALERIRAAAIARTPFSMLRIGDGEAVLLSIDESAWLNDLAELHRHWGAERVTLGDVLRVRHDLETALADADLLGIRPDVLGVEVPLNLLDLSLAETGDFVREHFNLRHAEKSVRNNVARRLALTHQVTRRVMESSSQEFCSSWIHWEMLASGLVSDLLAQADDVVLVTTHPELGPIVARKFDVRAHVVSVPGKFVDTNQPGIHVPDRYDEIQSELSDFTPGTLALVGAGIPGKIYCHWLKQAGCVALDVGSILDAWIGKPSRRVMLRERFGVADGKSVPSDLQLMEPESDEPGPGSPPASGDRGGNRVVDAGPGTNDAARHRRQAARRLRAVQLRLQRANRRRIKAERQRDVARQELAALRERRSVRAVLALARVFRGRVH